MSKTSHSVTEMPYIIYYIYVGNEITKDGIHRVLDMKKANEVRAGAYAHAKYLRELGYEDVLIVPWRA